MNKHEQIIACPKCLGENLPLVPDSDRIICVDCREEFDRIEEKPFLVLRSSPIAAQFINTYTGPRKRKSEKSIKLFPSPRIWSGKSIRLIKKILQENNPELDDNVVINMGSGSEKTLQKLYRPYGSSIIKVGLPHSGSIDIFGDAMNLPIKDSSVDLVLSSSVFEHLQNPEKAASELNRVLKTNGKIYVEIPFMRGYHMQPVDYQRYTIQGIEELFSRHGFQLVEKGVCSGTFNALALIQMDLIYAVFTSRILRAPIKFFFSWAVHPFKYLDRLFENSKWNQVLACNFYYYGKKRTKPTPGKGSAR